MAARAIFRRLSASPWLPAAAIFVVGSLVLPRPIAALATRHFSGSEGTRMPIAVRVGDDGLDFDWLGVPLMLQTDAYLGSADTPGTPQHPEFPLSVRFIRVKKAGVLMETVKRDGDDALTSRYLVLGRRVLPVSQMSFGVVDRLLAVPTSAALAIAFRALFSRLRKRRIAQAA